MPLARAVLAAAILLAAVAGCHDDGSAPARPGTGPRPGAARSDQHLLPGQRPRPAGVHLRG